MMDNTGKDSALVLPETSGHYINGILERPRMGLLHDAALALASEATRMIGERANASRTGVCE